MCGIQGIISKETLSYNKTDNSLSHRGPDDYGLYTEEGIFLKHYRLSIQDLSRQAHQPMISSEGNYIIIYNGEIYNHWEIRKKLEHKYQFSSTSDTETLLYGFIEFGTEILKQLNGIFSFAIYNKLKCEVFIARDPLGVKPLYYFQNESMFAFASEIKALTSVKGFDFTLDHKSLLNNLVFLYNQGEDTNFRKIKKLLPGHYILISCKTPETYTIKKYYDIPFNGNYSPESEQKLTKDLEDLLFRTIERQMLSDVPVGFLLSGGIDSSLLLAMTRAIYPERAIQCFTIRNGVTNYEGFQDDLKYAQSIASSFNVNLEVIKSTIEIDESLEKIIYHLDEAQTDPASFHLYSISKRAKEMGYKVLLSGTGADELFSGYRRHQSLQLESLLQYTPNKVIQLLYRLSFHLSNTNSTIRRFQKIAKGINLSQLERLYSKYLWLDIPTAKELFSENIQMELKDYNPFSYYQELLNNIPDESSSLNKMLYWDLKTYLLNNNLNYTDKMGMAHGVEIRVPYLDLELVNFTSNLSPELKLRGYTTKYLLRKIAEKYLPQKIVNRSKTGFGAPIRHLVRNEWNTAISKKLNPQQLGKYKIFRSDKIGSLIQQNKSGKIDASYSILSLVIIQSWLNQFSK